MRPHQVRRLLAATSVAAAIAAFAAGAATSAQAAPSAGLLLNEVYGGGGNSGATLKNDFIELVNRGSADASVSGWSVQYTSANPGTWQVTTLSGVVPHGGNYLVEEAAGMGGTQDLPAPDATGSIAMAAGSGTVALVHSTAPLTCATAAACSADTDIIDLVGYGTATVHEGTADAPLLTNTTSAQRTSGPDTDQNGTDFTSGTPTPANSGITSSTRIHDIQGPTWVSPLNGKDVTDVPGIVTAVSKSGSRGFYLQDPDPDDNPATSEGVFVFTSTTPTVAVGDSVLVSGTVDEFYGSGEDPDTTTNLSVTEIEHPQVTEVSQGNPLPAPIMITSSTVPGQYAPALGGGNIENTPITPARSALDYYESIEGMRVELENARVTGPTDSFDETYVTSKPTQDVTYRGGTQLLGENQTPSGRIEVVPVDGTDPQADVGDLLGDVVGPVTWSSFGGYLIAATALGDVTHNHLAPVVATAQKKNHLAIATYNVENLAPSDPDAKFQALAQGVVTNLATPDIVALEEVQDNTGATDDGTVAADQTITKLTNAIIAAGGPHYDSREVDPVNDQDGGQPGGNIRVVFLYNPARVTFVDSGAASVNRSTTGTSVVKSHGEPALTLSPGRIDPTNPVWSSSRKPLVGQFRFNGKDVFVIANHFDSKLGDQNSDGRFQFPAQSSAIQRAGQALVVHDFVDSILAVDKKADVVVVGDLNDYQFSPALNVLKTGNAAGTGTPNLTDLITTLPQNQQYTYDFDGISEVLDHILVAPKVGGLSYQVVHVNSEYHDQVSDHDPQVVDLTP